ncbi:MAG: hypothetical protein AAGB32_06375 [Pseudomonadota bacterium]
MADKYKQIIDAFELVDAQNPYKKTAHRFERSFVAAVFIGIAGIIGGSKLADHYIGTDIGRNSHEISQICFETEATNDDAQICIAQNEQILEDRRDLKMKVLAAFSIVASIVTVGSLAGAIIYNRKASKYNSDHSQEWLKLVKAEKPPSSYIH